MPPKGKRSKKKKTTSSSSRKTPDEIIGVIRGSSRPTKKVCVALQNYMKSESQSDAHQTLLSLIQSGQPPSYPSYETQGMVNLNTTALLYPGGSKLMSSCFSIPSSNVSSLKDMGMGEEDSRVTFPGGNATIMQINSIHEERHSSLFWYLGLTHFVSHDLWDFAVMFRKSQGTFEWPGLEAVLMCPCCGKFAIPDDTQTKTWIMCTQLLMQEGKVLLLFVYCWFFFWKKKTSDIISVSLLFLLLSLLFFFSLKTEKARVDSKDE